MHQAQQSCAAAGTAISTCTSGKGTPASGKGNKRREQEEREQEKGTSGKGNAVCEADSTSQLSSKVLAVFHSLHHLGQHHQRPPRCRALSVPPSRDGKVISSPASAAFLTQGSCSFTMPVLVEGKADTMALLRPVSWDISCQHEPVTSLTAPRVTVSLSSGPCSDGSSSHGAWHWAGIDHFLIKHKTIHHSNHKVTSRLFSGGTPHWLAASFHACLWTVLRIYTLQLLSFSTLEEASLQIELSQRNQFQIKPLWNYNCFNDLQAGIDRAQGKRHIIFPFYS